MELSYYIYTCIPVSLTCVDYSGIKYVLNRSLPALFSLCCYVVVPDVARELLGRTCRVAW